jgi:hypothetical protein
MVFISNINAIFINQIDVVQSPQNALRTKQLIIFIHTLCSFLRKTHDDIMSWGAVSDTQTICVNYVIEQSRHMRSGHQNCRLKCESQTNDMIMN